MRAFHITCTDRGDARYELHLRGELDVAGVPALRRALDELIALRPARVDLDATRLELLSAAGIATVLQAEHQLDPATITITGARPFLARVLAICDLDRLLEPPSG